MFTIAFNTKEKTKLLEILEQSNAPEAKDFIQRVQSAYGFFVSEDVSEYFEAKTNNSINQLYESIPPKNPGEPSGVRYK